MAKTKGNGGKAVAVVLALAVLAGGVCACGYASRNDDNKWFSNSDFASWHWSDRLPDTSDNEQNGGNVNPGDNTAAAVGGSDISDIESNGVTVYKAVLPRAAFAAMGVSEQAESAYTLTAEVSPDYASDKSLDWTKIDWQDGASEWATGKAVTDYVTVTPSADGSSAVLACLQDFGEPIVLTVSSVSNPEVCATCFVNYYQRVKSCDFAILYDGEEVTPTIENGVYKVDYTGAEKDYTVELRPVYSAYTLEEEFTTTVNGALTSAFGYTATLPLNSLAISAGLTGGDPALTENALNWCNWVKTTLFSWSNLNNGYEYTRGLCMGYNNPKYKLTEEEKQHPRCAYYISVINDNANFANDTAYQQAKVKFASYQPAPYRYYGTQIDTYNDFVAAVNRCNSNGVGVIEYTVTINGAHSNYTTVLSLGYGELKVNVQDIVLSDPNVDI